MKICSKCKIEKSETEFYARGTGLRWQCKSCDKIASSTTEAKNSRTKYRKFFAGTLADLESKQKYNQSDKGKDAFKRYRHTDKGRAVNRQKARRRRERSIGFDTVFSLNDVQTIHKRFSDQCFNCGSDQRLEIDHHYPLSRGYKLTLDNAVLLCKSCNSSKHDHMPEEFYSRDKLERLARLFLE